MRHENDRPDRVERSATASRRNVMKGALVAGAAAVASGPLFASPAAAAARSGGGGGGSAEPRPIPFTAHPMVGNIDIHSFPPMRGLEHLDITDFKGVVGVASTAGTGTNINLRTGEREEGLPYHTDLRFFAGSYVGMDGELHEQTFAHI